jgi:ATP-binding cassette subfamily B protein RaxB
MFSKRVPYVAASEHNECGLACIAAISEFHRGEHSIKDLRAMAGQGGRGMSLLDIRNLAERLGLTARGVRLEPKQLASLPTPAILHWEMNHFVVLDQVTAQGLVIMDPTVGTLRVPWSEVDRCFTGVALELRPNERWQIRRERHTKASVFAFAGPYGRWRREFMVIAALSIFLEMLVLLLPMQVQLSVDNATLVADHRLPWILGIGFGLFALGESLIGMLRTWSIALFGARLGYELRDRFVRSLHAKPAEFFVRHHTADLMNRHRSVDVIQGVVTAQLIQALLDGIMLVVLGVIMFTVVPKLAVVVFSFAMLNLVGTILLREPAMDASRRFLSKTARADEIFLENVLAARTIKLFGREDVRVGIWRNRYVDVIGSALQYARALMYSGQLSRFSGVMGTVVLVSVATAMVIDSRLSLGTMMMFVMFQAIAATRLANCANYVMELRRVQTHVERIDEVLERDAGKDTHAPFVAEDGVRLELRDVWFRYGNDAPWILCGVNLVVEPGESLAITGPSGCGKTTLMLLMLGLLKPSKGEILVNGRNLSSIASRDYARIIGAVMQDDALFRGTVADNVAFFDAPVDMERVAEACRLAHMQREVEAMPMAYYSMLAEGGGDISGGQKQRLFIARAIYHRPEILFLDEATSHLDLSGERRVNDAIKALSMTRILIAHRTETIQSAGRIVAIDPTTRSIAADRA